MKSSEVLKKARALLLEKGWCKGELARNKYRHKVDPTSPNATRFCSFGAIHNILGIKDTHLLMDSRVRHVSTYLSDSLPENYYSLLVFNDNSTTSIKDIDALFTRAIKLAKKSEKQSKKSAVSCQ